MLRETLHGYSEMKQVSKEKGKELLGASKNFAEFVNFLMEEMGVSPEQFGELVAKKEGRKILNKITPYSKTEILGWLRSGVIPLKRETIYAVGSLASLDAKQKSELVIKSLDKIEILPSIGKNIIDESDGFKDLAFSSMKSLGMSKKQFGLYLAAVGKRLDNSDEINPHSETQIQKWVTGQDITHNPRTLAAFAKILHADDAGKARIFGLASVVYHKDGATEHKANLREIIDSAKGVGEFIRWQRKIRPGLTDNEFGRRVARELGYNENIKKKVVQNWADDTVKPWGSPRFKLLTKRTLDAIVKVFCDYDSQHGHKIFSDDDRKTLYEFAIERSLKFEPNKTEKLANDLGIDLNKKQLTVIERLKEKPSKKYTDKLKQQEQNRQQLGYDNAID